MRYSKASEIAAHRSLEEERKREADYLMNPATRAALRGISPELVVEQLKAQVARAIQESPAETDKLVEKTNYPGDLSQFLDLLSQYSPKRLMEAIQQMSPNFPFLRVMDQRPLAVLAELLNVQMNSDRLAKQV
jgi:hypothetical protein